MLSQKMGTQMEEDEAKERAVEEGLKYAARDAGAYEARCLLEPAREAARAAAKTRVDAREVEEAARLARASRWRRRRGWRRCPDALRAGSWC